MATSTHQPTKPLSDRARPAAAIRRLSNTLIAGVALGSMLSGCTSLSIPTAPMSNAMDTTVGTYQSAVADGYILVTMTDLAHDSLIKGEKVTASSGLPPLYANFLSRLARTYGLTRVADWPLGTLDIRCLVFSVNDLSRRDAVVKGLAGERFVETAQPMQNFSVLAEANAHYNDPYMNLQHGLSSLNVLQAHRFATGRGVRVAVIDTGLDTQHEDLKDRMAGVRNFVDRNTRQFRTDQHGTAVASVIAASSNNDQGIVGVAPEASVMGLKACWQTDPTAGAASCNSFTLAKAINFAINRRVDIINLSLAGPRDPLLERLVARALQENILVVGAVSERSSDGFPAAVEGVIAGTNNPMYVSADTRNILAPGNNILSAAPKNTYEFQDGSSFSAAHLSGVAALIRQRRPHLPSAVVHELLSRASDTDSTGTNACLALSRLLSDAPACDIPAKLIVPAN